MLLHRKRINKWAKWVALFLAVVFAAGFLFLGVGYGGAGFNLSSIFTGSKTNTSNPPTQSAQISAYQATLAQNPKDVSALLGLANIYQQTGDLKTEAAYLERVIAADPSQKDIYMRLATIYMDKTVSNYDAAATVLNKLVSLDPQNPDAYLELGVAQNSLGHIEAAMLAWQRYLQLAPNGDMVSVVKDQLNQLSKLTSTTAAGASTSTTAAASSSSTAGSTTSTGGPSSTTATTTPTTTSTTGVPTT